MRKTNFYKFTACALMILTISASLFLLNPKKSYAVVPTLDVALNPKESIADSVMWMAGKAVIRQFTTGIINWINTGFEGEPMFITDMGAFLRDVANEATGIFLEKLGMTELCTPFRERLLFALRYKRPYEVRMQCTLQDVVENIEDFEQDFSKGGWKAWLSMTTQSQNNIYGAYLESLNELEKAKARAEKNAETEALMNQGFLSMKVCSKSIETAGGGQKCEVWKTTTPGKAIEDQLADTLGSDIRQLELADEFNEIAAAALNQMIGWVITGGSGGKGMSAAGSVKSSAVSIEKLRADLIKEIDKTIDWEVQYKTLNQSSITALESTKIKYKALGECNELDYTTEITGIDSKINNLKLVIARADVLIGNLQVDRSKAVSAKDENELALITSDYFKLNSEVIKHDLYDAQKQLDAYNADLQKVSNLLQSCLASS